MPIVATAIAATQAVTSLVDTITNIADKNKRRLYEQNLASLSFSQQEALARFVNNQASEEAKLKILADTLGRLNKARINSITQIEAEKEKTRKYLYVTLAIGGIMLLGVFMYVGIKKRK
jgi:hypothetical protein